LLFISPINVASPVPKNCYSNDECSQDEFCDTSPKCQDGKASGICTQKPQFCEMILLQVKGCDGVIYPNQCVAQAAGQSNTGLVEKSE
jgi:hypothetical protein